jgi:hypothetical protein
MLPSQIRFNSSSCTCLSLLSFSSFTEQAQVHLKKFVLEMIWKSGVRDVEGFGQQTRKICRA